MKQICILVTACLLFAFNSSMANQFVKKTFFSTALNKDKTYYISYPDGYDQTDTTKKYPVMVFLHGASVNAQDVAEQLDSIVPLARFLIPNLFKILFVIADGSEPHYLGSFYTNSELYGNFETYIATDLYKEIRQNYNTYKHREKWSIIGHSMGGYGSMKIALKYPDQFIGVAALSGPLHITHYDDILPLLLKEHGDAPPYNFTYQGDVTKLIYSMAGAFSPDKSADPPIIFPVLSDGTLNQEIMPLWEAQNPINLIRLWKGKPKMAMYLYCGVKDEYKLLSQNQIFSDSLTANNITHTFRIDPEGDHVYSLLTSLPLGLNFLYGVMDTAKISSSSILSISKKESYIYPNPVKDRMYFSASKTNEIERLSIISISGSTIKSFQTQNLKDGLDISNLKPSCYLLSVSFLNGYKENYRFIRK
jgi:predicted esterase